MLTLASQSINVFAKENSETEKLNAELLKNKAAFRKGEAAQDLTSLVNTRKPFTWEALKRVGLFARHFRLLMLLHRPGTPYPSQADTSSCSTIFTDTSSQVS